MAQLDNLSSKRSGITQANTQMLTIVVAASVISVFCLMASHALWQTNQYRGHVISKKQAADKQLDANIVAADALVKSYNKFVSKNPNILNGSSRPPADGLEIGPLDGNNAKLVLDALPSLYDFPALTASIEKILNERKLVVTSITGLDDQVAQQANISSPTPEAVPMPFTFSIANANYGSVQEVITALQRSIRPIVIDSINVKGSNSDMILSVTAHTFYQPAKNLQITKEVVTK
jgi:hypothetical protein